MNISINDDSKLNGFFKLDPFFKEWIESDTQKRYNNLEGYLIKKYGHGKVLAFNALLKSELKTKGVISWTH